MTINSVSKRIIGLATMFFAMISSPFHCVSISIKAFRPLFPRTTCIINVINSPLHRISYSLDLHNCSISRPPFKHGANTHARTRTLNVCVFGIPLCRLSHTSGIQNSPTIMPHVADRYCVCSGAFLGLHS